MFRIVFSINLLFIIQGALGQINPYGTYLSDKYILSISCNEFELQEIQMNNDFRQEDSLHDSPTSAYIFSKGKVSIKGDTIICVDGLINREYSLVLLDEFRVKIQFFGGMLKKGEVLYVHVKNNPNCSGVLYTGGWKNGLKDGIWLFWNERKLIKRVVFFKGKVIHDDRFDQ